MSPKFDRAIIIIMEVGNIRLYKDRWKAVEEIEAPLIGLVGRLQSQVPLADDGRVITASLQLIGQGWRMGIEPAPRVFGVRANHAGDANPVGILARKQRRPRRRADRAIGPHRRKEHPLRSQGVDVGRSHVRGVIGGDVAVTEVIGQNQDEIRARRGFRADCDRRCPQGHRHRD